jgi:hypothetical protein
MKKTSMFPAALWLATRQPRSAAAYLAKWANLTLVNSTLTGNVAGLRGGGLGSHLGYLYLNNDTISFNSAIAGGGVYNLANLGIVGCTISSNAVSVSVPNGGTTSGSVGAGLDNAAGHATIVSSTISGNSLQWSPAGAVTIESGGAGVANAAFLSLNGCTISGNSLTLTQSTGGGGSDGAVGGVGIFNTGALTAVNCTISSNVGRVVNQCSGGGIFDAGSATILNSTIANNSTDSRGGGIFGTIELLANSLVVNNSTSNGDKNLNGSYTGTFNFIGSLTLGALQNNGGPTFTQALPAGSPAIDAGNPLAVAGVDGISHERSARRPVHASVQ